MPAIDRIRQVALQRGDNFDSDLVEYLREGIVVSNPLAFIMALPITIKGDQAAWFIKAAAGDLRMLANMLPAFRPWVVFDRARGSKGTRVYSSRRILQFLRRY